MALTNKSQFIRELDAKNGKQRTASNITMEEEKEMQNSIDGKISAKILQCSVWTRERIAAPMNALKETEFMKSLKDERGDVPGWVLVVLMTTGLVTAIWTIAAPRLSAILKNSLDAMNGIR